MTTPSPHAATNRRSWSSRWARLRSTISRALFKIRGGTLTATCVARSVAWGLFVGSSPFFGLHAFLCLAPAPVLRVDPVVAYAAAHVSIPPLVPFLLYAEVQTGSMLLEGERMDISPAALAASDVWSLAESLLVGYVVFGTGLAIVGGALSYALARPWLSGQTEIRRVDNS